MKGEKKPQERVCIRILNWAELTRGSAKSFYAQFPFSVIGDSRFALKAEHFAAYWRLVALAGQSKEHPGAVHGTLHSISTSIRAKPEGLLSACRELQQSQLVQLVRNFDSSQIEYKREIEENSKEGPAAGFSSPFKSKFDRIHSDLREAFDLIPADIRRAMDLEMGFNTYFVQAIDEAHKLTEDRFKEHIYSAYPGQCRDFDFAFAYCRIVLQSNRGVTVLRSAIHKYASTRESNYQQLENFLKSKWWELLRDDRGNWPKSIKENLAPAETVTENIIYQVRT